MAVEVFGNVPTTTVSSGGTTAPASGTIETWTVASSAGFPAVSSSATPPTQIHIADIALNSEMIAVTNISGTTWTVTRGAEGTTPVSHGAGLTIYQVVSAGAYGQLFAVDWLNAVTMFGADNTGAADPATDVNLALANGGVTYLPAGTYKLNGSSALAMTVAGTVLCGAGEDATIIEIGSSFSAAEAISITASFCAVRNLSIIGASSTITSNPVMNGVEVTGAEYCKVSDVFFQYLNGWCVESVGGASLANIGCRFEDLTGYNNAGGVHVKGVTGSSFGGQQWITNPHFSQIGTASGGSANLDCIRIEDASDVYVTGFDGAISDVGTGSTLHVKGLCSAIFGTTLDVGCFPNTTPAGPVILIEDSANGSVTDSQFMNVLAQEGLTGMTVSGAASRLAFTNCSFKGNSTHGVMLSGTGSQIDFTACTWNTNGAGATGTNYDLNVSGTPAGYIRGCHFLTAVTLTGVAGVQSVVAIPGGQNMPFEDCDFSGSGVVLSTAFTNLPTWIRNCRNYNPHGAVVVTVPGSGSASAALHYDSVFYITANATSFAFTATNASPCVFTATGSAYANGNQVTLSGTSLPAGFTAGTSYFVVSVSGTTFELSATSGGSAINSTSTGSGTVAAVCSVVRNTNGFGGGTGPAITIPAGQCVPVPLRAGGTLTPTFAVAPTWVVDGQ